MKPRFLTFILFCFTLCSFAYWQVPLCSKCHKPKTACICKATPTPPQPAKCKQCGSTSCRTKDRHRVCPTCGQYDFKCRNNCKHPLENFVPEYVDLGLSVKWAICNVGATRPEEYGDYFAWGETKPKKNYKWSTYIWCNGSKDTMTKYCTNSSDGQVDNKTTLDPEDDAAHVNWGGTWRMPTKEEMEELHNECTWTWTSLKGINGYKVISKTNGNSIFLPAADHLYEVPKNVRGAYHPGYYGHYWSSSLSHEKTYSNCALKLWLAEGYSTNCWGEDFRHRGLSVRPVCP